jgi:hypothetical protein
LSGRRAWGSLLGVLLAAGWAAAEPFEIQTIPTSLRIVQADLVDLDGDGIGDLIWIGIRGMPPEEERTLHIHFRRDDRTLSDRPDATRPLPDGVAAYDLANVDGRPGAELLLLRRHHVNVLSMHARRLAMSELPVPGDPTIAAVHDERGVDRLRIARDGLGRGRLLIPGLGRASLLQSDGTPVAELDVGGRANFFVPRRPGPLVSENEMEIYFDHPRLTAGDVDGDGRADLLSSDRHELRIFLQDDSGGFTTQPQHRIPLRRLTERDHIRTSGAVRVTPHDFDGDGRVDLLISSTDGSLFGGTTRVTIHLNRNGGFALDAPDQGFEVEGGAATHEVRDLDGDGRAELAQVRIPTGVLELVEVLLTRAIDAEISIRRPGGVTPFEAEPWQTWKLGVGISFETFRSRGFVPALEVDLNGDGFIDLLGSGDGEQLEIRLGDRKRGYRNRSATQDLDTGGRIRFGDADGNTLPDFVLYDSRRPGTPIRVGRNRGELEGSPPEIGPLESEPPERIR